MKLGKIKQLPIRQVWPHEADLDRWLLSDDNITQLGEEIDMTLCDFERQKQVGPFRCDIVCKEANTDEIVVIENQFNETNHDHLGKLISYASNLNATAIIWLVEDVDDVHAGAIEWLNKHTDNTIGFYLVQVQAWQINDSLPAPKFIVIEQPNGSDKIVKSDLKLHSDGKRGENTHNKRLEFWKIFNKKLSEIKDLPFSTFSKPSTNAWFDCRVSSSKYHLSVVLKNAAGSKYLRVGAWVTDKQQYKKFEENKNSIEAVVPNLTWDSKPHSANVAEFYTKIPNLDLDNNSNWNELMEKAIVLLLKLEEATKNFRIK